MIGKWTVCQDTSDLRSGEEDVGEWRLGTLARGGDRTLIETLLIRIHELNPDFLACTVLTHMELIVCLEKVIDCEHTSANITDAGDARMAP